MVSNYKTISELDMFILKKSITSSAGESSWSCPIDKLNRILETQIVQEQYESNVKFRKSINEFPQEIDLLKTYVIDIVKNSMKDGITLKYSYSFDNEVGELDGLVAGTWNNEEVIIFVDAKHDMENTWKKSKKQSHSTLLYWKKLIDINLEKEPDYEVDYVELRIKEYGNRKPMYAFGGTKIPLDIASKLEYQQIPCIFVTHNNKSWFLLE